ncbi:MAG: DUF2780 domain-containing protein [Methylococcales bacterium]
MKKIKMTLLCSSLVLSGTASAGWLDFLNQSTEEAAKVESTAVQTQGSTAQSINQINNAVKAAQVASDVKQLGLTETLVKQLGVSQAQAQGGSGALFQVAKSKMTDAAFSKVSESVPGMSGLLGAVPQTKPKSATGNLLGTLAAATGNDTLVSAASLVNTFQQLDMSKGMVSQFVPVVIDYVKKNSGDVTANLLSAALTGL